MNKIKAYLREVHIELFTKVTWPSWKDLQSSAIVVMIASMVFALVVFAMDATFEYLIKSIYALIVTPIS